MTQELTEKIRDTLSIAYQVGFTHKSAGNMAYLEVDGVLDALMDSIILADKIEIPKPDHIAEVSTDNEDDVVWRKYDNGEYGCSGCICNRCANRCDNGACRADCNYYNETFICQIEHPHEVVKECKHFKEMEEME